MIRFTRFPRGAGRSRGQGLVEFALVLPLFVLLLFGFIDIGRYVFVANELNQAAREGARAGAVEQWFYGCPAGVSPKDRFNCTRQITLDRMVAIPSNVTATVTCQAFGTLANKTAATCGPPDLLTVDTRVTGFRFLTPIISNLLGTPTITGQAQVLIQ